MPRTRLQPWMLVSAAWTVPAVLGVVNELAQRRLNGGDPARLGDLLFASGDWLVYALLTPAVFAGARRWPLVAPIRVGHIGLHLGLSLVFCAAWAGAGAVLRAALLPDTLYGGFVMHFVSWLFITLPFGVAVYLGVVAVEHAIRYVTEARRAALQNARLREQLSSAQLAALESRLNPHFLFNTLNTIVVLVRDHDTAGAARLLEHLSQVLRRTLRRGGHEAPLEDELQLVREYLAIERARFSDRLHVEFDVDPGAAAAAVPVFSVQHLAENAVRHGIARSPDAGRLTIAARRDGDAVEIVVSDDGEGIEAGADRRPGGGLENTRARLRALYGARASLTAVMDSPRGTRVILRVPYRRLETEAEIDGA